MFLILLGIKTEGIFRVPGAKARIDEVIHTPLPCLPVLSNTATVV